ncbi:hypothetical protein CCACVL1_18871 [Corchorus capsularis]|uniref:Uncharacterized protein n=1 Tax=Corchorus capsularis TaxID=210143 RepID=A0A1R3HJK6_COCAP|nr:hypothetical protein CCACVL1_18871 [Corchorus capsularis]
MERFNVERTLHLDFRERNRCADALARKGSAHG